jgi:hypothetical protein
LASEVVALQLPFAERNWSPERLVAFYLATSFIFAFFFVWAVTALVTGLSNF